jgi:hypothetical protein
MGTEFASFANAWYSLSFFRYNKHTMNKFYNSHVVKLILDYDKPIQNITSYLFDIKNASNPSSSMSYQQPTASIFKCQTSLNKLCVMLSEWCDIVLMENCVYLKLIELGSSSCREKSAGDQQQQQSETSDKEQQDNNPSSDFMNISSQSSRLNQSIKQMNVANNGSCLLIRMDTQYAPYVSVLFLFHASIPYLECVCLLNTFEEKIKQLNLQSFASNSLSSGSNEKTLSNTMKENENNSTTTTPTTTPTGGASQTNLNSAAAYTSTHNTNTNSYNNNSSNNEVNECCHILKKTDIFETMKKWLFDEANFAKAYNNDPNAIKDNMMSQIPNTLKTNYLASKFESLKKILY